jgi:hypothetical protein
MGASAGSPPAGGEEYLHEVFIANEFDTGHALHDQCEPTHDAGIQHSCATRGP